MPSASLETLQRHPFCRCLRAGVAFSVVLASFCASGAGSRSRVMAQARSDDSAEKRELAEVRALFDEGVSYVDRRRWADAEDRFRRCLSIRRSPVIEYNLASALEAQGELAEAATLFRAILEEQEARAALRRASAARLARIEPRLAHVTLVLLGAPTRAEVSIDGRPIPLESVGAPLPIDPGRHEFAARDEKRKALVAFEAEPGDSFEVELSLGVPNPAEAAALAARGAPRGSDRPEVRRRRSVWIATGSAVVAVILTAALLAKHGSDEPRTWPSQGGLTRAGPR